MAESRHKLARRREMRRHVIATEKWWRRAVPRQFFWAALWVYVLTVVGSLIAFSGQNRVRYRPNQITDQTIVARVGFEATNQKATEVNRQNAAQMEPAVYVPNTAYFERVRKTLEQLGRVGADPKNERLDQVPPDIQKQLHLTLIVRFQSLRDFVSNPTNPKWAEVVDQVMSVFSSIAILPHEDFERERHLRDLAPAIVIRPLKPDAQPEQMRYDEDLIDIENANERRLLEGQLNTAFETLLPPAVRGTVVDILVQNDLEPTYLPDAQETKRRRDEAAANRAHLVKMNKQQHDVLVEAGRPLTAADLALLDAEERAYQEQLGGYRRWLIRLGAMGLILLLMTGLFVYVAAYKPRLLQKPLRGLALVGLILLCQALAVAVMSFSRVSIYAAALPVLLATMVLAIVYDRRFALAVGAIVTALVMFSLDMSLVAGLAIVTGVTVTASQLREVRNRSTVVLNGLWAGLATVVAVWLVDLTQIGIQPATQFHPITFDSVAALLAGVMAGLIVQGLLPAIEKAFNVTTSMTLKDLNDASHPLLRRLAQDAPGTYQHSLRIADMAEAAADTIGGNGLLCRVGAMYHDIGKMNKPAYFIENQQGGRNRHDKLRPAMSLLIIVGHVKDGVEMAREFKLPRAVRHFIESHHGTTLVEYFYHAARKQSEEDESPAPTEFEFRYPGPKPQTKEAAILMLADCVESAARSLPEPTPVRLEQLVGKLLNKRLMDGQFDECNITLSELHKVEQSVVKTVTAIYHGRIAYPKAEKDARPQPAPQPEPAHAATGA